MSKNSINSIVLPLVAAISFSSATLQASDTENSHTNLAMADDPYLLEFEESSMPIVLTTTRLRQPQLEVPASVTVIDREMIEMIGARELPELLRMVPGMSIGNVDGNIPTVSYHATVSRDVKRMQVMIDGRSVYQPGLARVLWDDIPLTVDDIQSIEVTRGPNAAAYGPNSFSAIINIITRHPQDTQWGKARIGWGNNGIRDSYVRGGAAFDDVSFRVAAYGRSDDGYDVNEDGIDRNDKEELQGFNARTVYQINSKNTTEFHVGYNETKREIDSLDGWESFGTFEEEPDVSRDSYFGMFKWRSDFNEWHSLKLQLYSQKSSQTVDWQTCMNSGVFGETNLLFTREAYELREFYRVLLADDKKADEKSFQGAGKLAADIEQLAEMVAAGLGANPDPDVMLSTMQTQASVYLERELFPAEDAMLLRARDIALANEGTIPILCGEVDNALDESRVDLEVVDNIIIGNSFRFVFGGAYREEKADSRYYINGSKESNKSSRLFTHMEYRPVDKLLLNLGYHYEDDSISGLETSPRVAMSFLFGGQQSIRMVYSEATRSVDIYEDAAAPRIYLRNLSQPYANDVASLLGQSEAIFYMREDQNVKMVSEKIKSSEIGYYGFFANQLEVDVRIFEEKMTDLFSDSLNLADFDPNNHSEVTLEGAETQAKWRISRSDLLMIVATFMDNEPSTKTEARFSVKKSSSLMYNHKFTFGMNLNFAYHYSDFHNPKTDDRDYRFKRFDAGISQNISLGDPVLTLSGKVMYRLDHKGFLNDSNLYEDKEIYFLTAAVHF